MIRWRLQFAFLCALCGLLNDALLASDYTNTARLKKLPRTEANRGQPFALQGSVTFVDHDRNLFVLQDETGALAIHPRESFSLTPGDLISVSAPHAAPYVINFPAYPYQRAGVIACANFESPSDWGNFHLTRMSGFLRPPTDGEYTFWIASDNSSELWLSSDADPSRVHLLASVRAGNWVNAREWGRYQSQRSEPVQLAAGHSYYIEAFAEQQEQAEHLSVAWQGPGFSQELLEGQYLSPWTSLSNRPSQGLLLEYYTNFALGSLTPITGDKNAEFAVSADTLKITRLATDKWPHAKELALDQQLPADDMYRRVRARGTLDFVSVAKGSARLELKSAPNTTIVNVRRWLEPWSHGSTNYEVEVTGVVEGAYTSGRALVPGVIWAESEADLVFIPLAKTNPPAVYAPPPAATSAGLGGFLQARGAVTFNGRAFGQDYFVVQDGNAGVFITPSTQSWPGSSYRVGDWVEIGGSLLPSRFAPRLKPSVVNVLGTHILPDPMLPITENGAPKYRDGQWTELEGTIRAINTDGSLTFRRKEDTLSLWIAEARKDALETLLDAKVRVRGVVFFESRPNEPTLLVPARQFVEVIDAPPKVLQPSNVSYVLAAGKSQIPHRVRVSGVVTYRDANSLFIQDNSAAVRVRLASPSTAQVGDPVDVIGFPELAGSLPVLADALVQRGTAGRAIKPFVLNSGDQFSSIPNQSLAELKATLLSEKQVEGGRVLELQLGQRVLQAVLAGATAPTPKITAGSLLRLTGVCVMETASTSPANEAVWENSLIGAVRLLLRTPADVVVLRGPPWWNLRKVAVLVAILLLMLFGAVVRVQLLRRRFEKQQAARLAFAKQLLENQESERRRIAANLHDSLGQNLLAIKNQAHLALQSTNDDPSLNRRLEDISGTVMSALEEVRQITHDLRPYQLDRLGLRQAIVALVRRVSENSEIEMACHVDDIDGLFPGEGEINVYRIVQEGVNNVLKHSQATEATVVLRIANGYLLISVRDNGRGLEPNTKLDEDGLAGFGLSGISERARIMGGKLELESNPGEGFNVKVTLPLPTPTHGQAENVNEAEVAHS